METAFSHYKIWEIFRRSWAANSVVSGPIWPKFDLVRDFMHVLVNCKYKTTDDDNGRRTTTDDDGRMTDHRYTISSPCEPSAQVS